MHLNGSEESFSTNLKRAKCDDDNDSEQANGDDDNYIHKNLEHESSQIVPPLLRLSDDVLLMLISQLDKRDLVNVGRSCQRLYGVSRDHTLWTRVDLRSHNMMLCQLNDFMEYFQPSTKFIASRGCVHLMNPIASRWAQTCAPCKVLHEISKACPRLETFIAEEQFFDARWVSVKDFPSSLKNLTLKTCEIYFLPKDKSYFHGISRHMPYLEVLILDDCQWLTAHSLMAISKCPNLQELRLKSCRNLGECVVYTSLAARFGFKALKILDVRETSLADNEISCFRKIDSLTHLYLACPRKRTPNDVDPVQACCQATAYQGKRSNKLADAAYCYCNDDDTREVFDDACDVGECSHTTDKSVPVSVSISHFPPSPGIICVNFFRTHPSKQCKYFDTKQLPAFINEDLPEYLETETLITDRGIMQLGARDIHIIPSGDDENDDDHDPPISSVLHSGTNKNLSSLVINNCKGVTDSSLAHLAKLSSIKYLNVSGTSVTQYGIQQFLTLRHDVKVVSDFQS